MKKLASLRTGADTHVTVRLCGVLGWFIVIGEDGKPEHLPEIQSVLGPFHPVA
jgi:hypothetical protein